VKVRTIRSEPRRQGAQKDVNYLVCNDKATLLYLANLGCIELNPWLSRTGPGRGRLERPDFLLIDLDAKTSEFRSVVGVAQEIRELLEAIGANSYPKTSGKSGMHICLPLGAKYDYKQSRQFAELLMQFVHRRCPDLTSLERSPHKRQGRVYLDFLQNNRAQTMAAPYCVRPVPGATVSAPLEWDEVKESVDPRDFTIRNIEQRVQEVGDLWKPVLGKGIDLQKALGKLERFG
ncbi:MAG: DNA ligase, partial [Patescibacteria group bacterium]|nr:DNA ligase [Patescibacteria group bacterium]